MIIQKPKSTEKTIDAPIRTTADKLAAYVTKKKKVSAEEVAKALGIKIEHVEKWANVLEEYDILSIDYSTLHGMILKVRLVAEKDVEKKFKEAGNKSRILKKTIPGIEKTIKEEEKHSSELEKQFVTLHEKVEENLKETRAAGLFGKIKRKIKARVKNGKEAERQFAHKKLLGLYAEMKKLRKEIVISGEKRKKIKENFKELKQDMSAVEKKIKKVKKPKPTNVEEIVFLLSEIDAKLKEINDGKKKFADLIKKISGQTSAISSNCDEITNKLQRLK